jgi:uncharacterized protein YecT (DUF1311 family)
MSLMLAGSALLWACADDGARTETAAAHARDSALAHDLVLAGYDSSVIFPAGRDTRAPVTTTRMVTESPGVLAAGDSGTGRSGASTPARSASAASVPSAEGYIGPSCASPARDDQQQCLKGYLARSDAQLDRSYQALIVQLKTEAGPRAGAKEPPAVQRLRTTQRNWLVYRDDDCRKRTAAREGPLWAPVRAKCLAEYSALRQRELDDALSQRKPAVTRSSPAKPKATKATKATKRSKSKRRSRR